MSETALCILVAALAFAMGAAVALLAQTIRQERAERQEGANHGDPL